MAASTRFVSADAVFLQLTKAQNALPSSGRPDMGSRLRPAGTIESSPPVYWRVSAVDRWAVPEARMNPQMRLGIQASPPGRDTHRCATRR